MTRCCGHCERSEAISCRLALVSVRRQGGGMGEIAEQEKRVAELRHSRGEEHPETLTAMLYLAELLWKEGRLRPARMLEEQVVAARLRLFGEKHPDTLKAMGKLATTIGTQGDLTTARALQARIVELAPEVWGEDGRDRWRALNNLAGTVAAEGDLFARARIAADRDDRDMVRGRR